MTFDTLTWHLLQEDIPLTQWDEATQTSVQLDTTVTHVDVRPIINGQLVNGPSGVFDTLAMLVRQHNGSHRVDLWTCSCGVAGCVGIHDEMSIEVTDATVSWHVPREEPFIRTFETTWFNSQSTGWKWTFFREQYIQAIDSLKAQILTMEAVKPVVFWRDEESKVLESLSVVLESSQKQYYKYEQRKLEFQQSWGILHHAEIKTKMGDLWYVVSAQSIVSEAAEYLFENDEEQQDWIHGVALPKLRAAPDLIYEMASNLTYDLVSNGNVWWLNIDNTYTSDPSHITLEQRQNYWLDAHRELVFDDSPRYISVP